ncbi:PREDICTED: mu-type opioid receptor [Hipposideros armiger]|uniref:Mu-type opioid receptor n=1 Tax=Hipposideros armiger TaxID=186990 RepID=A0A8B7RFX1_HIPAR|nr:PREDICTED: mu-type opioid receptor [Hipposideros armiger]
MDSGAVPRNASNCTDPFARSSSCSPAPSPGSWVNFSHLDGNLSDPCGPNRTELGGSDSACPPASSPSMVTAITIMALYSVVCVVGLFGNFLVMYVIVRFKLQNNQSCPIETEVQTCFTKFRCSIDCTLTFSHPTWYWENLLKICVFIFAFIMPVLIITVCYGLMILRLKSVRMLSGSKEKDRNLRRITRMVLVQNSTRIRQNTRDHPSTANTVDRTNHQQGTEDRVLTSHLEPGIAVSSQQEHEKGSTGCNRSSLDGSATSRRSPAATVLVLT